MLSLNVQLIIPNRYSTFVFFATLGCTHPSVHVGASVSIAPTGTEKICTTEPYAVEMALTFVVVIYRGTPLAQTGFILF